MSLLSGLLRRSTVVLVLVIALLGSLSSPSFAKKILIYGPSLYDPVSIVTEKTLAEAAGHTVTVVDATTWLSMTTADFKAYDAIVIGELRGEWWNFWYGWFSRIWWLPDGTMDAGNANKA